LEVLVGNFTGFYAGPTTAPEGHEATTAPGALPASLVRHGPPIEVLGQLGAVLQVIADDLVDVGQLEAWKILSDLFRSSSAVERADHEMERDPAAANTVHSAPVFRQWNCIDYFCRHNRGSHCTRGWHSRATAGTSGFAHISHVNPLTGTVAMQILKSG